MLQKIKKSKLFMEFILAATTFMWGMTYLWSGDIADLDIDFNAYASIRYGLCAFMFFVIFRKDIVKADKKGLKNGSLLGILYYVIAFVQILALKYTTPANSAFIFSAYVILVPIFTWLVFKTKPRRKLIVAVVICVVGIYFLNMSPGETLALNTGNLISLGGAGLLALQVVFLTHSVRNSTVGVVNFVPSLVVFLISTVITLIGGGYDFSGHDFWAVAEPILLLAIFGTVLSGITQAFAQQYIDPNRAAVIYSLESVFACLMSVTMGYEPLTKSLILGGTIIVAAILIMEVDIKAILKPSKKNE